MKMNYSRSTVYQRSDHHKLLKQQHHKLLEQPTVETQCEKLR